MRTRSDRERARYLLSEGRGTETKLERGPRQRQRLQPCNLVILDQTESRHRALSHPWVSHRRVRYQDRSTSSTTLGQPQCGATRYVASCRRSPPVRTLAQIRISGQSSRDGPVCPAAPTEIGWHARPTGIAKGSPKRTQCRCKSYLFKRFTAIGFVSSKPNSPGANAQDHDRKCGHGRVCAMVD